VIYTIPHYPVHLIDIVPAANGRRVTIRPMLPQDFGLQREFFHSLSPMAPATPALWLRLASFQTQWRSA